MQWLWGADWKFRHEGNCSASRGFSSDAEQLSREAVFSIRSKKKKKKKNNNKTLWIRFLAYFSFKDCI